MNFVTIIAEPCISAQVEKLARQFGVAEDVAYTCETAAHFWLLHVLSRWEKFLAQAQQKKTPACIKVCLPTGFCCFLTLHAFVLSPVIFSADANILEAANIM